MSMLFYCTMCFFSERVKITTLLYFLRNFAKLILLFKGAHGAICALIIASNLWKEVTPNKIVLSADKQITFVVILFVDKYSNLD